MLFFSFPTILISLFTIIILFNNLKHSHSFTQSGYYILDLETPTLSSEIGDWTLTAMQGGSKRTLTLTWGTMPATWILGGPWILGPPGQGSAAGHYFIRTYTDIKPHTYVSFTFTVWYFDNWYGVNNAAALTWYIDDVPIAGPRINYSNDFWSYEGGLNDFSTGAQTEDCGFVHVRTGIAHTGSTMTFKITGRMTGELANERFGFRDLFFTFHDNSGSPSSPCHLSDELHLHNNFVMAYDRCNCDMDEYPGAGGICRSCPARWEECWTSNICFKCNAGLYWSGSDCCHLACKSCSGTTSNNCPTCQSEYFNYGNNSCMTSCNYPFKNRTAGDQNMCDKPCPTNQFYFEFNDTCLTTCPSPLKSRTDTANNIKYCYNPCSATEQFLYQDSTCMNNCQSPLALRYESGVQYCWNPCANPSTDFLFTNGSCVPTCPIPLASRQDPGVKYCYNPCPNPDHQYLYLNGTCLPTCGDPLSKRFDPGVQFCENPCLNPTDYLYANKSCYAGCVSPLVKKIETLVQFCNNPCGTDTMYLHMNGSCYSKCVSPLIERWEPGTKYCFTPCTSTQYLFTNESCVNSCPSPLVSKTESGIVYCYNPCQSDTLYLYTNGSCFETCPFPLTSRTEPGVTFCYTPCPTGQYLYFNQTCSARCDPPLISRTESGALYCFNPCPDDTLFLYPNRSCFENCPYPLISRSEPGTEYCLSPCPPGHYLYPNQSCFPSCLFPMANKIEPGVNFCFNPCLDPDTEFLFPNQSCFDNCPAPLVSRSEPDIQFCFNPCPDPTTDYLYPNGTCSPQCNSPLVIKIEPDVMYCINPCPTASLYLYANRSCLTKCTSPLVIKNEPGVKFCFNPCPNPSTEYLYTNGSCIASCIYPLATRSEPDVQYCFNPCQPNQYLYPNQTCSTKCPSPLVWRSESGVKYCFNPCPDPIADFLYTNGSCLPTCPSPLYTRTESGVKYCYSPCPSSKKYLYPNGSCIVNCPTPLLNRTEPNVFYCYLPCAAPNLYWYANTSCMPKCNSPYQQVPYSGAIQCLAPCKDESLFFYNYEKACFSKCEHPFTTYKVDNIKVCHSNLGLDLDTIDKIKDTADSIAKQGEFTSGGMKAAGALSSNNPSSALLAGLSSMLQYIRYMKINYPPKVETLFMVSADTPISISFDFDIPPEIDAKMDDYPLPYNFDKYDINSNFVRNMWDLIGSFLASIIAIFALFLATKIFKKCPKIRIVFQKFLGVAKWNIPAMMLCSSSGDIFFFASLHLNVLHFTDTTSIICFLVLLFMVLATLSLWILTLRIVWTFDKVKKSSLEESEFKEKWQDYELLFDESEQKSVLTISYMTFFIVRGFIFNLTIGCLYEWPLIQVAIINASNFLMFGYLIVYRPLKEFLNLVQVFINEAMIIILSVSVLILAIMDKLNIVGTSTRVNVGEAILFVIQAFNTIGLVFMGIQLLMMLIFAIKAIKYFREKGIKNPLKMLQIIAFEEFEQEAGLEDSNNPLARVMKAGKKQKIIKPPRKERPIPLPKKSNYNPPSTPTDLHNTSSTNLLTDISTRRIQRYNKRRRLTSQSPQTQTTEIDASETQSRLDLSFNTSPAISPLREGEATFRFDQSEILNHNPTEEEIRNSLNKSMRKLRLRAKSSSPLRRLNSGNLQGERSFELDKSGISGENQNDMTQITLFPDSAFGGGNNDTSTINLFSEAFDTINTNENNNSIYDSLRKLKERRNRVNTKEEPEGTSKAWFNKIRKFKEYLKKKE